MKIKHALNLLETITMLQNNLVSKPLKFGFALAYNKRILDGVLADVKEASKDEDFEKLNAEFDSERVKLVEELAEKDENGRPVIVNNSYKMPNESEDMVTIQTKLQEKFPDIEKRISDRMAKIDELLEEETDVVLKKVGLEDCSKDLTGIPAEKHAQVYEHLLDLVE